MPEAVSSAVLDPRLADEIVQRILAVSRPDRIVLFGSRARGDSESRSDIDLAISAPAMTRTEWLRVLDTLDDAETLLPIQVVRLEDSPAPLRERILSEGVVLYARPEAGR